MSEQSEDLSYEEVPYASIPFPQTHPDRMASVAMLFGLRPPNLANCSYLEVGCACADNLLPLAAAHPGMRIVGIDRSPRQIEQGRATARKLGVSSLQLECVDLTEFPQDLGKFDYIAAHGVYSWIPPGVRDSLMALIRKHLNPNGIAFLSYNILPGWYVKLGVRDLLRYHVRGFGDTPQQVREAMEMLRFTAHSIPKHLPYPETALYGAFMSDLVRRLDAVDVGSGAYLCHEYLEKWNSPLYFRDFVAHAAQHGLQYVADAEVSSMFAQDFAPVVSEWLAKVGDPIAREQYLDFFKNRPFRQSLITHAEAVVSRGVVPSGFVGLHLSAKLTVGDDGAPLHEKGIKPFKAATGLEFAADEPVTKCALARLSELWPHAIAFTELVDQACRRAGGGDAEFLASELAPLYAAGCIEAYVVPPRFAVAAPERPRASAWARHRAQSGEVITNLRHGAVGVGPVFRRLIAMMDGTRDRQALKTALLAAVEAGEIELKADPESPDRTIAERAEIAVARHVQQAADFAMLEAEQSE